MAATNKRLVDGDSSTRDGDVLQDPSDRYEETACVNHISQQLLISLLLPQQLRSTQQDRPVRVVFTGSALHRRLRSVDDLQAFFDPSGESEQGKPAWDMMRSYGASKFLQMLGVQHLVRMLQERYRKGGEGQVEVVVVQPGKSRSMTSRTTVSDRELSSPRRRAQASSPTQGSAVNPPSLVASSCSTSSHAYL